MSFAWLFTLGEQWWWFAPRGHWAKVGAGVQALRVGPSQGALEPRREIATFEQKHLNTQTS
ncbi:MAG: hypothetical protein C7N36_08660 [Bacteroidetes bacterium]|nr:MAG: hypothetical protein C7N36_08660 [Bacteroidota bacterium]